MCSNVRVRSNVYLLESATFASQVRGRRALQRYLEMHCPGESNQVAAHRLGLTVRQIVELATDVPCAECNSYPEGVVMEDGVERLAFFCPNKRCGRHWHGATSFRINLALSNRGLELFSTLPTGPIDRRQLIQLALTTGIRDTEEEELPGQQYITEFCVLTDVQRYSYGYLGLPERSGRLNAALRRLIEAKATHV